MPNLNPDPKRVGVFLSVAFLCLAPQASAARDILCETASGAPQPDPAALLAERLVAVQDGSAVYIERFDLHDVDHDGQNDISLMLRDESYDGNPVYSLIYYRGEATGFCGRLVFDGRSSLLGAPYELSLGEISAGYPQVSLTYQKADPTERSLTPAAESFSFSQEQDAYQQTK